MLGASALVARATPPNYTYEHSGGAELEKDRQALFDRLRKEIDSPRVIDAMERVPREAFVSPELAGRAYEDNPHPIGEGQTISQPFIVALMLAALEVRRTDDVLEVGAGSGYQAALLAELARKVVTTERIQALAETARRNLERQGYDNVTVVHTSTGIGWRPEAPYDAIVVAAAAPRLPAELWDQLADRGRLVCPVGPPDKQQLLKIVRSGDSRSVQSLGGCQFVPLIGAGAWPEYDSTNGTSIYSAREEIH